MTWRTRLGVVALAGVLVSGPVVATDTPLWLEAGRLTPSASQVLEVLRHADEYGLNPSEYSLPVTNRDVETLGAGTASAVMQLQFDRGLTEAAMRFVTHVRQGRVSAREAGFDLPAPRPFDAAGFTQRLARSADARTLIASLEPRAQPYAALKQALARYRSLSSDASLVALPPTDMTGRVAPVDYAGAPALRRLLVALGDLEPSEGSAHQDEMTIDAALAAAIDRFQARHGLQVDGVIGPRTFGALTTPIAERVRQIELSLERWRWLSVIPKPDIVINIPQFMLYALPRPGAADQQVIEMPVIVGATHRRTPVFTSSIEQVVFQPFWDVPWSIAVHELLPKIRRDPGYLVRHHFEIVRGPGDDATVVEPSSSALDAVAHGSLRLRQRPGPDNALGPIKFVLPNPYSVRLHGTPDPKSFDITSRALSHGCIRVSEPQKLAAYVLENAPTRWDDAAIEDAACGTGTLRVTLAKPVRVAVFYTTAIATASQGVMFSDDIYGYDRQLQQLLDRRTDVR
jgi:murein L,D-transpeptidase YcbB/YkuD